MNRPVIEALTKARIAWDLLSDIWNMSLIKEDRQAIGQDGMEPMMRKLKEFIERMQASLRTESGQ